LAEQEHLHYFFPIATHGYLPTYNCNKTNFHCYHKSSQVDECHAFKFQTIIDMSIKPYQAHQPHASKWEATYINTTKYNKNKTKTYKVHWLDEIM
jgi:hypothetical protein